jgi:hypothetical protein
MEGVESDERRDVVVRRGESVGEVEEDGLRVVRLVEEEEEEGSLESGGERDELLPAEERRRGRTTDITVNQWKVG